MHDPAEMERRLRADGVQIVERKPVDLRELYDHVAATIRARVALGKLVKQEREAMRDGAQLTGWHQTLGGTPGLSVERTFTRVAQLAHGATDEQVAEIVAGKVTVATLARVRKTRSWLTRRNLWIPIY